MDATKRNMLAGEHISFCSIRRGIIIKMHLVVKLNEGRKQNTSYFISLRLAALKRCADCFAICAARRDILIKTAQ